MMGQFYKRPLSELFESVTGGGTPPRGEAEYWNGSIPWASVKDFTDDVFKLDKTQESITELGLLNSTSKLIKIGTPIICLRMAVGRVAIANKAVSINQDLKALFTKVNVDALYLVYLLDFVRSEVEGRSIGSTVKGISTNELLRIQVPFPATLDTQKRIAKILSTVDNLIAKTQSLIDKYTAVKQGMMADLFTRGIDLTPGDNYGQLRPSVTEAPELYQQTELGWVPKDWKVVPIDEISTQMTNGFVGVATPHYANNSDSGIRYLYGNNVRADKLELDTVLKIKPEFHQKLRKSQLLHGDMLTVQSGHIGTSAIVPENFGEANCHALIITRLIKSRVIPEFLSYYLNSAIGMNRMEEIFVGSTIKHVNVKELKSFLVPLPSIEEQKNFVLKIMGTHELINNEKQQYEKHKLMKKGLMQDLLIGKVRVHE
jgi:type I restriction enzyme S subunit